MMSQKFGKLKDFSSDEQRDIPYPVLMTLRREAYAEHITGMDIPPGLQRWADAMTARHGPMVGVWQNIMPWLEAFMVVRYGEEPTSWPQEFSSFDVVRAERWLKGEDVPSMVTPLPHAHAVKEGSA